MSYTDNVAAFFDTVESQAPVLKDDLMLVVGDVFNKQASPPPTPTLNGNKHTSSPVSATPSLGFAVVI